MRRELAEGVEPNKIPIRERFFGCCVLANPTPTTRKTARNPANFRFWILRHCSGQALDFRLWERELEDRIQILSSICFSRESKIGNRKSKIQRRTSAFDPCIDHR